MKKLDFESKEMNVTHCLICQQIEDGSQQQKKDLAIMKEKMENAERDAKRRVAKSIEENKLKQVTFLIYLH